jgi:alpha-N-arabinofuranosidase
VADIPYIDVVATRSADRKTLTLLCVNRSLSADVPTDFDLGSLHVAGPVSMRQIASSTRYERNDEIEPNHVIPGDSTVHTHGESKLTVTLPHESVSVIRVSLR